MGKSTGTSKGGVGFLLMLVLAATAALALSGNAAAETGVPCAPTGLEAVTTDQQSYPPGETVYVSGGGFAVACDVELRITRPDGVVETGTATTDLGGNLSYEYVLPPPPGVLGIYTLEAIGLGGVVLATHTFTDGPEIRTPDLVPGYVTTGGPRQYTVLVRNTGDTTHRCIRVTLPAGYASISVLSSDASQGSFTSSINGQVITFSNSTGIAGTTTPSINGWARFDIEATPPNNGPNGTDWIFRASSAVATGSPLACPNTNQTSNENVRIVAGTQPTDRRYTAQFVTGAGAPITTAIAPGTNVTFRLRMTKLNDSQSNKISFFSVGLPRCLTNISITSAGENSNNGSDWTAQMFGKVVRWSDPTSGELDDGHSVTLTFTANTMGCASGSHAFPSTGWEDAAGSAGNAPSKLFTATTGASITFNAPPSVAANNATVTVNESQTASNTGTWSDVDAGDTVVLSASVGTVTKSGTNSAGTWSWSYGTTDGPAQTQVVTITANDGTASSSTTFQLNTNNVAPTATFNNNGPVDEGSSIELSLTDPFDPSSVDTAAGFEYRFSCDNGSTWTAWGSSNTASCSTDDNGTRNVNGEIRDKDGGTSTYSAAVTVTNVAPTADFNAPESVNEGSSMALSLTDPSDPSSVDTAAGFEYRFSCDDGDTWTVWDSSNSASCATTDNGTRNVKGEIRDKDGGTSTYSASVTVNNVAPSATFNAPESVDEGSDINLSLTDVVDPGSADTHEFRFSCDGGTTWTDWGSTASHSCSTNDNGTRSVKGQVHDDDGGMSEYSASVTVNNVAPSATFNNNGPVNEGSNIELSLTDVVDPGTADTHEFRFSCDGGTTWTDWGSSASHSCSTNDNGTRNVKGQVRDDDGGESAVYSANVTINNVAPTATFNAPESVNEGSSIALSLTDPSDPSSVDTAAGFEYRFSCDNGDTWTAWGSSNSASCPTTDNSTKNVNGEIRDKDGGVSTYSASVTVNNVAPSATFNVPESVDEGSNINLSLTNVVDPGSADTHEFRFSCDGGDTWTDWGASSTHACATDDNGTVEVRGQVRDDDGGAGEVYSDSVTVNNVAPTATFNNNGPVNEGSNIELSLTDVVDPGSADTHEFRFSCDGGTTWTDWGSTASHSCSTNDNGTRSVKGQVRDDDGGMSEYSASVTVNNVAPSATFNNNGPVNEGSNINLSLTDPSDPSSVDTGAGFEYRFSCDNGTTWTPWGSTSTASCPTTDNGTRNVNGEIRDKDGGVSTNSAAVTVNNVAPSATFNNNGPVDEGSNIHLSLTSPTDPSSADTAAGFVYAFDCGDGSGYGAFSPSNTRSCPTSDNGTRNVGGKIKDKDGGVTEYTATVTVNNVPPTLHTLTPSSYLVLKGSPVTVTGTYTDPGTGDTFTCIVNWDQPTGTPESVAGGPTSCSASHTYTAQGTYTVSMKVRDDDDGESNTLMVIITVYDPSAGGFVTGGGWINSPAGSYAADPTASGRANFGFNSQYKKGANVPTGETEFQLHFATFNFHSEAYEVLVVSGYKAQYRGTGKVNGVSGHKFVLTAYDGQITGGGGVDRFRIKITRIADDVVVYDTKMGVSDDMDLADPLAIGGGSIVIHKAK